MLEYVHKTRPFKHQEFRFRFRDEPAWGIFWEQGTGKSKQTLDTAAYHYELGNIDAMLIVAPNGVHWNWVENQIPAHLPDRIPRHILYYQTSKSGTQWHQRAVKAFFKQDKKQLLILAISYNGFMTKKGKKLVWKFLKKYRCLYVLDEGHFIKSPGAKRTISIVASGRYAPYKRILTGTPIAQGAFDAFSQMKFLDEFFWRKYQLGSYNAFKNYFGVWRKAKDVLEESGYDPGFDQLLGYRYLEELKDIMASLSDRITKEDAGLDLPPELYSKRYYEMLPAQQKAYDELRDTYITELEDGAIIEGDLAIVRLLRLQQITCGYAQTDAKEPIRLVDPKGRNPRLQAALDDAEGMSHGAIFWCRFRHDVDQLMEGLHVRKLKAVRFDGRISDDECKESVKTFQAGKAQFFVANLAKGVTGLDLFMARTVNYYSSNFNLIDRLQSQARAHRIGQKYPVNVVDYMAKGTVDEHITKALRTKKLVASLITGDTLRDWI